MKIALVGWGSVIWEPREMPVRGGWHLDGPLLPIEFARAAADGRNIPTAVLLDPPHTDHYPWVRTLWALLDVADLDEAIEAVRIRERTAAPTTDDWVGRWPMAERPDPKPFDPADLKPVKAEGDLGTVLRYAQLIRPPAK